MHNSCLTRQSCCNQNQLCHRVQAVEFPARKFLLGFRIINKTMANWHVIWQFFTNLCPFLAKIFVTHDSLIRSIYQLLIRRAFLIHYKVCTTLGGDLVLHKLCCDPRAVVCKHLLWVLVLSDFKVFGTKLIPQISIKLMVKNLFRSIWSCIDFLNIFKDGTQQRAHCEIQLVWISLSKSFSGLRFALCRFRNSLWRN